MTDTQNPPAPIAPPSRHQLALMIWLAVFPTLTLLNVALDDRLDSASRSSGRSCSRRSPSRS